MPILPAEPDCHPADLLEIPATELRPWWLAYTRSRQEKQLMRRLRELNIDHYAPQIVKRRRSPAGRVRITYQPLFISYVFICGDDETRYQATCTGCIMQIAQIEDSEELVKDLRQIQRLIQMDVPLSVESRLKPGQLVRVKNGAFAGYEGTVVQRMQETRLLVCVRFMEQGVSVKLDDCQLEKI
ncbi:transcription termination/antitermination protein NusG [Rubripirellula obstinata]|uniref:transcription termination/antitermination protein NusG n=1 Tax=Rubripirellula obstinata TaxID=406547 RepID=UPI00083215F4|nr:transcription termination/antitermination NusG family protein [Rubripirellula obstinata]